MLSVSKSLAIRVMDVYLTYRTTLERRRTLRNALLGGQRSVFVVEALRGVTFDVPHGAVLGVVGVNGAGKSTLVRTVAGILPPTSGRVEVRGRVSTLLSLGVGFNPNLTGRENVFLGGLAAGMTKDEIAERYQEISDFAELEEGFMDVPMRLYSSGMYSRLAFAVAVHMDPDILIIDEALSAGDARFKHKSSERMKKLCAEDRTIFLVSHALGTIKEMCTDTIWLHKGRMVMQGGPEEVVESYTNFLQVGEDAITLEDL